MNDASPPSNFLTDIIEADLAKGKNQGRVVTRFPPEPNGFLHIGHTKSILLNFGLAARFGGQAHLRFDDTNPTTEDTVYVEAIQNDVKWLGCEWGSHLYFASDYFPRMFECALRLVREGKAFVDTQPVDAIRAQRGDFSRPGTNSPFRDRSVDENLTLFTKMREGSFADGEAVLRAKIDMAHPNVLLRDPLLYRVRKAHHHRTGDTWCIYPMYDFAHPLEDAFEGVTHSICTLEFESNRDLYDWVLDNLGPWEPRPRQYEFARLALGYTVMSKRKLLQLVKENRVSGWDDPRMPTVAGMRRRGVRAEALRDLADLVGVAKNNSVVDIGKFEFAIRNDLEPITPRAMAVLHPLAVTITNYPEGQLEMLDIPWWPNDPSKGSRKVPFGRDLFIEREDFSEDPPKDWKRLAPGREVRLAGAHILRCDEVIHGPNGEIYGLHCSYDTSAQGSESSGRKIAGTLHWVHAADSLPAPVRLYDRLFTVELPDAEDDFLKVLNPDSLETAKFARVERALKEAQPGDRYQFLRLGYFFVDPVESKPGAPVFNRTISLKDTWGNKVAPQKAEVRTKNAPKEPSAPKKPRVDHRAELRAQTPELAERFAAYQAKLGLPEEDADILTGDLGLARYFDAAVAAHPNAKSVARWLTNDLLGLAKDRALDSLALTSAGFGRLVALVDAGKLTAGAGKTLLTDLVEHGGDPQTRMAELGLEKVQDAGALDAAIDKTFAAQAAEVARYRAGEKKLFGVLIGSVMRELQGAADAAAVRQRLTEKLG